MISHQEFTKKIIRAQELISEKKYTEAVEEYKKVLEKNPPEVVKIYYQIGELYSIYLSKYKESIEFYKKAVESAETPLWMVKSQEKMAEVNFSFVKDYKEAAKNYKKLVEFLPKLGKHDFYQYRLALSYLNSRQLSHGYEVLKAIQANEKHEYFMKSMYQMGMYYFLKKQWAKSIEHWENYIRKEKRRDQIVRARFLMANAYETMNDLKKSYDIYYSLLARYPNMEVVRNRLQSIYFRRNTQKR